MNIFATLLYRLKAALFQSNPGFLDTFEGKSHINLELNV